MAFGEILLAGYSGKSRAGKMAPSCPLGSQLQHAIWFILPAREAGHIIRCYIALLVHNPKILNTF